MVKMSIKNCLGDIADIGTKSSCFMERYFRIDVCIGERISKVSIFSILDDCYPWDLSEIYDAPAAFYFTEILTS